MPRESLGPRRVFFRALLAALAALSSSSLPCSALAFEGAFRLGAAARSKSSLDWRHPGWHQKGRAALGRATRPSRLDGRKKREYSEDGPDWYGPSPGGGPSSSGPSPGARLTREGGGREEAPRWTGDAKGSLEVANSQAEDQDEDQAEDQDALEVAYENAAEADIAARFESSDDFSASKEEEPFQGVDRGVLFDYSATGGLFDDSEDDFDFGGGGGGGAAQGKASASASASAGGGGFTGDLDWEADRVEFEVLRSPSLEAESETFLGPVDSPQEADDFLLAEDMEDLEFQENMRKFLSDDEIRIMLDGSDDEFQKLLEKLFGQVGALEISPAAEADEAATEAATEAAAEADEAATEAATEAAAEADEAATEAATEAAAEADEAATEESMSDFMSSFVMRTGPRLRASPRDPACSRVWVTGVYKGMAKHVESILAMSGVEVCANFDDWMDGAGVEFMELGELALYKARELSARTGLPAIAERTSLLIEASNRPSASLIGDGESSDSSSGRRLTNSAGVRKGQFFSRATDNPAAEKAIGQVGLTGRGSASKLDERAVTYDSAVAFVDLEQGIEMVEMATAEVALKLADRFKPLVPMGCAVDNLCRKLEARLDLTLVDPESLESQGLPELKETASEAASEAASGAGAGAVRRLKEAVLKTGRVLPNGIVDVSSFVTEEVDVDLMDACAAELARRFQNLRATKILTVATTGLVLALPLGRLLQVRLK